MFPSELIVNLIKWGDSPFETRMEASKMRYIAIAPKKYDSLTHSLTYWIPQCEYLEKLRTALEPPLLNPLPSPRFGKFVTFFFREFVTKIIVYNSKNLPKKIGSEKTSSSVFLFPKNQTNWWIQLPLPDIFNS